MRKYDFHDANRERWTLPPLKSRINNKAEVAGDMWKQEGQKSEMQNVMISHTDQSIPVNLNCINYHIEITWHKKATTS